MSGRTMKEEEQENSRDKNNIIHYCHKINARKKKKVVG